MGAPEKPYAFQGSRCAPRGGKAPTVAGPATATQVSQSDYRLMTVKAFTCSVIAFSVGRRSIELAP